MAGRPDLSELQALISGIVRRSPLAGRFRTLELDSDEHSEESGFIRVLIHLDAVGEIPDGDLRTVTGSIEDAMIGRLERFPSVRFREAA